MAELFLQVCLNHPGREAAARCPECRRFYCRECVVEHDERLICAPCLRKISARETTRRFRWEHLLRAGAAGAGVLLAWVFFFWLGQALLNTPSSFHEGTLWKKTFLEEE
jgi:hypothetical protein